jgi:predicted nucleic acid-binding protein
MKVTVDTSILLELWKDHDKRAVVERLLRVAEEKGVVLAITARVREDIPEIVSGAEHRTRKRSASVEQCGSQM